MESKSPKALRTAIQVMVFQDGLSSRSFEIPLKWLTRLGWYFGASLLVTILSVSATIHFWRQGHRAQPERLRELEQQILALKESPQKSSSSTASTSSVPSPLPSSAPTTAPIVCAVPPLSATPQAPAVTPVVMKPEGPAVVAYRAFPPAIKGEIPLVSRPSVPLEVSGAITQWQGRKLKLQFDIRFVGVEGQNQQGRILVLARGPDLLLGYPSGAIRGIDSSYLLDPEKGEFFSVSRFRQTKVEFPAVDSRIESLEILLFGVDGRDGQEKLLIRELLKVPPPRGGAREAAPEEN